MLVSEGAVVCSGAIRDTRFLWLRPSVTWRSMRLVVKKVLGGLWKLGTNRWKTPFLGWHFMICLSMLRGIFPLCNFQSNYLKIVGLTRQAFYKPSYLHWVHCFILKASKIINNKNNDNNKTQAQNSKHIINEKKYTWSITWVYVGDWRKFLQ